MKQLLFTLAFIASGTCTSWAQGRITVSAQPGIEALMNQFARLNKNTPTVEGWRIQLLATTDRQEMESALNRFRVLYPSISVDWVHSKPYYKIYAGAFESKLDALRILYILKRDFPGAYPAMDNTIRPSELMN